MLHIAHVAVILLLVIAAATDLRYRIIPNWLVLTVLGLTVFSAAVGSDPATALSQGLVSLGLVLAMGFILFLGGFMGGGDIKLLAALAFAFPPTQLITMLIFVAIVGLLQAVATVGYARIWSGGKLTEMQAELPYGLAIAIGGGLMLALQSTSVLHG